MEPEVGTFVIPIEACDRGNGICLPLSQSCLQLLREAEAPINGVTYLSLSTQYKWYIWLNAECTALEFKWIKCEED